MRVVELMSVGTSRTRYGWVPEVLWQQRKLENAHGKQVPRDCLGWCPSFTWKRNALLICAHNILQLPHGIA